MRRSTVLARLLLASLLSVGLWIAGQHVLGSALRGVVAGLARLCDERVYDVDGDRTALVVGATPGAEAAETRVFGVSLLRWHVNVIAAPILAMMLGSAALVPRLIASAVAVVLTVVLDGAGVFLYLLLGVRRLRGTPLLGAAVDDQLAYAIAVFGVKLLPVVAWALAYGVVVATRACATGRKVRTFG